MKAYPADALYRRGMATLVASWMEDARCSDGAHVVHVAGVAAAVFPCGPERDYYNNALLERGLSSRQRAEAIEAMESAYVAASVDRFAAWAHESDRPMHRELERRGYRLDTTTRAMGMTLHGAHLPNSEVELAPPSWHEHVRVAELPRDFLAKADPAAYHVAIGKLDGENVSTAIALDLGGDCGIYNVGTLPHARRRGLAAGVTTALLRDALTRGCLTASLQATPMAEPLYLALGFRDLGRICEYVPTRRTPSQSPTRMS